MRASVLDEKVPRRIFFSFVARAESWVLWIGAVCVRGFNCVRGDWVLNLGLFMCLWLESSKSRQSMGVCIYVLSGGVNNF